MLSGDGRTMAYTSFNKPKTIQQNNEISRFSYGPDNQRYKQVTTGSVAKTTYYVGAYEKEIRDGQTHHRIQIGDFALIEKVDTAAATIHYTLNDDLGTLVATVDPLGDVKRLFYDPWGKRINLPILEKQSTDLFSLARFITPRGFTNHEHLDNVGLIHMNGRVYDPEIARFVSADPFIKNLSNLQNYNRYSYALNNPLRYTDPSGFFQEEGGDHAGEAEALAEIETGRYDPSSGEWDENGHYDSKEEAEQKYQESLKIELEKNAQQEAADKASRIELMREQSSWSVQQATYKKNQLWFTWKFKNEQKFVEAFGVDGETVMVFGKRGLSYYSVKVGGLLLDLLNYEVLHEHALVITPEGQVYNLGFSSEGLFSEEINWQGFGGKSYAFSGARYVISGSFDYKNFLNNVPGNWNGSDYSLRGIGVNNCQSYIGSVRSHIESTLEKQ